MSRRIHLIAAVAALCAAPVVLASDTLSEHMSDRICTRDATTRLATMRARIAEAFAQKPEPVIALDDRTAPMGPVETIVARIGTDGKPVMSCVDSPEAAERFLTMAVDQLPKPKHKQAKEQ
jgi:hypothetical protein